MAVCDTSLRNLALIAHMPFGNAHGRTTPRLRSPHVRRRPCHHLKHFHHASARMACEKTIACVKHELTEAYQKSQNTMQTYTPANYGVHSHETIRSWAYKLASTSIRVHGCIHKSIGIGSLSPECHDCLECDGRRSTHVSTSSASARCIVHLHSVCACLKILCTPT